VTVFLLIGCNKPATQDNMNQTVATTINIVPQKATTTLKMSEIFASIEYIPLETPDEHLIGEIFDLLVFQDRFYIFDKEHTKSVFCFSHTGKFLYEINKIGNGPGEYTKIDRITINYDNKTLVLFANRKLLEFDLLSGDFLSESKTDLYSDDFAYIGDNSFAFYDDYKPSETEKGDIRHNLKIIKNKKIKHADLFFSAKVNYSSLISNYKSFQTDCRGNVIFLEAYNDTLYHLFPDKVERKYYVDFGNMKKPKQFYSLMNSPASSGEDIKTYLLNHNICNITEISETETCLYFSYYHKMVYHFVFYNKNTQEIKDACKDYSNISGLEYPIENDIDGSIFTNPYFTDGSSFYGSIDTYKLKEYTNSITNSALKKMVEQMVADNNPVIVKMIPKNK
jgi:hypothetical protein